MTDDEFEHKLIKLEQLVSEVTHAKIYTVFGIKSTMEKVRLIAQLSFELTRATITIVKEHRRELSKRH